MKINHLNKEKKYSYTRWGKSFELTFMHSGLGLYLSFEIYKIKTGNNDYQKFLENFYFPVKDSSLPKFLPLDIEVFYPVNPEPGMKDEKKPSKIISAKLGIEEYFTQISNSIINENNALTIISGESGSGKTATFLAIANQCTRKNSLLFENGFIPCLINFGNEKNADEIILNTLRNKIEDIDKFLEFSPPLLFFIDLNAIQRTIISEKETINFENRLKESDLSGLILEIRNKIEKINKISGNKHRLFVLSRPGNNSSLYKKIVDYGITWKLQPLHIFDSIDYIISISRERFESISYMVPKNNNDFLTVPIFVDFINWLSLKSVSEFKDINILSLSEAEIYLIFTREFLRNESKQWKKNELFSWTALEENRSRILEFNEKDFSQKYFQKPYSLEEEPNQIELLLMIIARELGSNFIDTALRKLLENIILNTDYKWLDNYRYIMDKIDSDKKINIHNIVTHTILKYENDTDVVFFHQSISDYFHAKSIFYDLKKGNLVNIDDKNHFIKQLNKCNKYEVFPFFIELFEKQLQNTKDFEGKTCFDILNSLNLNDESLFSLGKAYSNRNETENGKILYQKSIQKNPGNVKAHNNLGLIYKNNGEYDKAENEFRKALKNDSKYYFSQYHLGETLFLKREFSEAILEIMKAIEMEPNDFESYILLSDSYSAIGKTMETINTIESIPETCVKEKGMIEFMLGKAYFEHGDIEKSVIYYKKSIEECEVKEISYVNLGLIYINQGKINESIEMFENAIRFDPTMGIAYSNLGLAYFSKGDNHKAIEYNLKALECNPNIEVFHNNLGLVYLKMGKFKDAINEFLRAIELNPDIDLPYINLASVYYLQGKANESAIQFKKALKIRPDSITIYIQMGNLYCEQYLFDKAIEQFNTALEILEKNTGKGNVLGVNPSQDVFVYALNNDKIEKSEIYLGLLNCYSKKGDFEKFTYFFEKALESAPENERVYAFLGDQYRIDGQIDQCIKLYEDGLSHFPNSEILNCLTGDVYLYIKNLEKALVYYQIALETYPLSLRALCGISDVYSKKGNYEESLIFLKKALEVEANYRPSLSRMLELMIKYGNIPETIISLFNLFKILIMEKTKFTFIIRLFLKYSYRILLKISSKK